MDYNGHDATYLQVTRDFVSKGPRLAPAIRLSVEPLCFSFGALVLSAGYRFQNDVPLEIEMGSDTRDAKSDLKHKSQVQLGALLRFDIRKNIDAGIGVDARNDWMEAPQIKGTKTQNSIWRPWIRANARYLFDKGANITPFVGIEGALALGKGDKVHPQNYYLDYAVNTGDKPLGPIPDELGPSPNDNSFVRGHVPLWDVTFFVGARFGRRSCGAAAPVPVPVVAPTPQPTQIAPPPPPPPEVVEIPTPEIEIPTPEVEIPAPEVIETPPPVVVDDSAERAAREAAERAAREAAEREAREKATQTITEVEGVRIHFATNGYTENVENRTLVRNWAAKYKNSVEPGALLISGHTDRTGAWEHNQALSVRRANTLAAYLRREGINVPAANIVGRSWDEPIADNSTPEGLAKNRRADLTVAPNNPKYRVKGWIEGQLFGVK